MHWEGHAKWIPTYHQKMVPKAESFIHFPNQWSNVGTLYSTNFEFINKLHNLGLYELNSVTGFHYYSCFQIA